MLINAFYLEIIKIFNSHMRYNICILLLTLTITSSIRVRRTINSWHTQLGQLPGRKLGG